MRVYAPVLGLAFAGGFALVATDAAADGYASPGYAATCCSWAGFYAGVNGGYAWSDNSDKFAIVPFGGLDPKGGFGGGQIGYNWQSANFVFGIEADIQGSDIRDRTDFFGVLSFDSRLDYFGTVRGRLGYVIGPSLLYATGGFAYGGIKNEVDVLGISFVSDHTATGYTIGGGWEYKFARAWSLKAEYQFVNLGRSDPTFTTGGTTFSVCTGPKCEDDAFHTVRIGLNYQFGDRDRAYAPLK